MTSRIPHETHPPSPLPSLTPPPTPRTPPTQLLGRTLANPPPAPQLERERRVVAVSVGVAVVVVLVVVLVIRGFGRVSFSLLRRAFARGGGARVDDAPTEETRWDGPVGIVGKSAFLRD